MVQAEFHTHYWRALNPIPVKRDAKLSGRFAMTQGFDFPSGHWGSFGLRPGGVRAARRPCGTYGFDSSGFTLIGWPSLSKKSTS